jgi:asparagine synthase (glutamine-hydrolysing)
MCGIAGFIHKNSCTEKCQSLEEMVHASQSCRGPENSNTWTESYGSTTVHLFHQRLRIQDLSSSADQPMHTNGKSSHHIVFNGEIYNKEALREAAIPSLKLITHSDTEVLLEAIKATSLGNVVNIARGMFAFGLVNSELMELELARDRFGEKPLHYTYNKDFIFFSSQFDTTVNAMKLLGIKLEVDQDAIYEFLALGYFPTSTSLYKGVFKLAPTSLAKWKLDEDELQSPIIQKWDNSWRASSSKKFEYSLLEETLKSAITEQLIGDVPIGVFLSGGCDSTLVSAIAQGISPTPIHSFSLGFAKKDFDESKYALQAARELGTIHHAYEMDEDDALDVLPIVLKAYPEPLGDPSIFPTVFISREAKKVVTVILTGDGADELFFGYGRYSRFQELEKMFLTMKKSSPLIKKIIVIGLHLIIKSSLIKKARFKRLESYLKSEDDLDNYLALVGFAHINSVIDFEAFNKTLTNLKDRWHEFGVSKASTNKLREIDVSSYLVDDILVKVDRAAMASSLETRAPFLDARISEIASHANDDWLKTIEQKHVIKVLLEQYVSSDIFRRPKMGFGAPIGDWFRTSLHDWAEKIVFEFEWPRIGIRREFVLELWSENEKSSDVSATYLWMLISLASSVQSFE